MKNYSVFLVTLLLITSCGEDYLDRYPQTSIGKENFFLSENDLSMYIYSLYNYSGYDYIGDAGTDNTATTGNTELKTMMISNPSAETISSGWSWDRLREINFFIENTQNSTVVSENIRDHYLGVARMFRANFYYEKVKRYSNVPIYSTTLNTDSEELYNASDPRTEVFDFIMDDYQFAIEHINETGESGEVNRDVAKVFMMRTALHEGTYRKYHTELNLESTAENCIQLAGELAKDIIDSQKYSIYNTGAVQQDYSSLFSSMDLSSNPEVILNCIYDYSLRDNGYWAWMFGNYESSPGKDLLQAYLMNDGSYYSASTSWETKQFVEEFENRDPRLSQSYAAPGWELVNTETYAQGAGVYVQQLQKSFTGYHKIKGFLNAIDVESNGGVDVPVIRYAEVLLTYAEALAELDLITQEDLDLSINKIRNRVGMPHLSLEVSIDPIQQSRYPNINNAVLLEIRRERRVELAFEGFRYDDLFRYNAGKLFEKETMGLYFPSLGKYDLTGDGIEDIYLISNDNSIPTAEDKEVNSLGDKLTYYRVGNMGEDAGVYLTNGTSGYIETIADFGTFEAPKYYYRPIPSSDVLVNPNLEQVFGW